MKMRSITIATVSGMAICLLGVSVLGSIRIESARAQYPGSVAMAGAGLYLDGRRGGMLRWQTTYLTPDDLAGVRAWYAARLGISPASELNLSVVDDCVWLSRAKLVIFMTHTVAVLACSAPGGSRIRVSETVRPGP